MKKVIITCALFISLTASAFASSTNNVDRIAVENFSASFKDATNVEWTVTDNAYYVAFNQGGKRQQALYTKQGEFIATSTAASLEDLPVATKRNFAKKYDGYSIVEVQKYQFADETAYYLAAQKDNKTIIVKVSETGSVTLQQK